MKPIMMNSSVDVMDDPFADLPALATEDVTFASPPPQLISPLEFGTGIKYLQEQQQQQQQQQQAATSKSINEIEKENHDTTETTVAEDVDDTMEETPNASNA
jgi:hypothetical protein